MLNAAFGNCKTAELHLTSQVQSFGALIAIDKRTKRICGCSANSYEFTGMRPDALLDQTWTRVFRAEEVTSLFKPADAPDQHLLHIQRGELNNQTLLIANHSINNITLVEMEAFDEAQPQYHFAERAAYWNALAATVSSEEAARLLMETIAGVTHFDRVMLYKFLPDWHGKVIAECLAPGIPGFVGLHFPASDIPATARRLYLISRQRVIADVGSEAVTVVGLPGTPSLDFTFAQLRAVHPVHIQYLKNVGVQASFSLSIIVSGRLWGLIACHHLTPKRVSLLQRQYCEEMALTTNIHMTDVNATEFEKERAQLHESIAETVGTLKAEGSSKQVVLTRLMQIRETFRSQGVLARIDGQDFHGGNIPDEISLSALRNWLETCDKSAVTAESTIGVTLAKYPALVRFASGILYLPLGTEDFLLFVRPEQVEMVKWAGKPNSASEERDEAAELTPRSSFQTWLEQLRGRSEPWSEAEIEAAIMLRKMVIELIERIQLESMALRDPLTGLANRLMFERALQEAIKSAMKAGELSAVFMLDLDKFKPVNDTMGHAAGDELLIEVGKRLTAVMRTRDTVARLGGDEFAIVQFNLRHREDSNATAERLLKEMRRPYLIQGQVVEIGASIGVSICPIHATEQAELLEDADLALYQAKSAGRNTFKSFGDNMMSGRVLKESTRQSILDAMNNGALCLVYQPIVGSKTRSLRSFEVFARWRHPSKGDLTAREFLPLIEQCRLTTQFAEWTVRSALQQGKLWLRKGLPLVPMAVNLSAKQFISLDIVGLCASLAREIDVGLEWLRFDLDEAAFHADFLCAVDKIASLAHLGVLINIDHFGQGLVGLSRIVEVKINTLKVTGGLFRGGANASKNDAVISIIRSIAGVMNALVVATQIETEAMESMAISSGIEYMQGFQICLPLRADDAEDWLRNKTPTLTVQALVMPAT
jgi:chemotaxis family two-component system sensor kinase Cph1